jgi:hypothetical protein
MANLLGQSNTFLARGLARRTETMSTRDTAIAGPSSACYESDDDIFSSIGCIEAV